METTPVATYRAVSSDGSEYEVTLLKTTNLTEAIVYARAPDANGQPSTQSRPAAVQRDVR
jgi:hypothetical protein